MLYSSQTVKYSIYARNALEYYKIIIFIQCIAFKLYLLVFYYTNNQILLFIVFDVKDIQLYNTEYMSYVNVNINKGTNNENNEIMKMIRKRA